MFQTTNNVCQSTNRGDELTLKALADYFGLCIHVITSTEQNWFEAFLGTEATMGEGLGLRWSNPLSIPRGWSSTTEMERDPPRLDARGVLLGCECKRAIAGTCGTAARKPPATTTYSFRTLLRCTTTHCKCWTAEMPAVCPMLHLCQCHANAMPTQAKRLHMICLSQNVYT